MNISLIITTVGFLSIIIMLLVFNHRMEHDMVVCHKCPYHNSTICWECKRKFNIKDNKHNSKSVI